MSECTPYNQSSGARGATDNLCPVDWPVFKFDQGISESVTVQLEDSRLDNYPLLDVEDTQYSCEESYPTDFYEGFEVGDTCYPEGAQLRFREHWDSSNVLSIHGQRVDTDTFTFTPTVGQLQTPGLFIGELVLYRPVDNVQTAVLVRRCYVEVASTTLTASINAPLSIAEIRLFLRDECPAGNFLIDDLEYTDKEIHAALKRCVDYWNETPPPIATYNYASFPFRYHWSIGAIGLLMRQAGVHKLRNFLDYSAGNVTVNDQQRWQNYHALGDQYWNEFREFVLNKKHQFNIERGFRSLGGGLY